MRTNSRISILPRATVLLFSGVCAAGDLNPPPGAVGDTFPTLGFKTLFQVEPRFPMAADDFPVTITASGSYYLTEHVPFLGAAGEHGIVIDADNVTIDLMGFTLEGSNEVVVGGTGILVEDPNRENIIIRNGFLRAWGLHGISLNDANNVLIENVGVQQSGLDGFHGQLFGGTAPQIVVRSCIANDNGQDGFDIKSASVLACTSSNNANNGFLIAFGNLSSCTAVDNVGTGIELSAGALDTCGAISNGGIGFLLGSVSASNCGAWNNGGEGFFGNNVTLVGCVADTNAGHGFELNSTSVATSCLANTNSLDGFNMDEDSAVRGCHSHLNGNRGVAATLRCAIEGCTVNENGLSGIVAGSFASVRDNYVARNSPGIFGTAGIVLSDDCFVDGNYITENQAGVRANGNDNIILRNIFNTNPTSIQLIGVGNQAPTSALPNTANAWLNISL